MTATLAHRRRPVPANAADRVDGQQADPAQLRNLGPASARMLSAAGITSIAQLQRLGAVTAFVRIKRKRPAASLNLLYALEGALLDMDWRVVRRERRLGLLSALDDHRRAHPAPAAASADLRELRNIGPAMERDLALLGIRSRAQLARADADRLYRRLQSLTRTRQDPCVWDTFAAAIHQARTGEALPWWQFTPVRKQRVAEGRPLPALDADAARRSKRKASARPRQRAGKRT